jgi:hypothetical protein
MHPYLMEALARDRIASLRGPDRYSRRRTTVASRVAGRRPRRERVGWVLVTLGLRLVEGRSIGCRPARTVG